MSRIFTVLCQEPLVHFLLLASLLFVLEHFFSASQNEKIIVDRETADFLIRQREDLELRKLTPAEQAQTITSFIEAQILYKEAYRRGLDKGDSRMRRNLILKMRGLLIGDIKKPEDEELREYFVANREKYVHPATLSLEHVYFSDPLQVPDRLLETLRDGHNPETLGETRPGLSRYMRRMTQYNLVHALGADIARGILAINDDQWYGPYASQYGAHFVRIVEREPAQAFSYEEVQTYLEGDWINTQSRRVVDQEIRVLKDNYDIIIEDIQEAAQ